MGPMTANSDFGFPISDWNANSKSEIRNPKSEIHVSVGVPNWNCRDLLRDCLASLLRQPQGVSLEVVVVDNASTDGAMEMVAAEFPEAILVRNATNEGFARASNRAAQDATG